MVDEALNWFLQCVDRYMQTGQKLSFHQGERQISFLHRNTPREIIIYCVVVETALRHQGICRQFLEVCQANPKLDMITVCGVQNPYLDTLLQNLGFIGQGDDYIWLRHI